jgi:hypothetical protein
MTYRSLVQDAPLDRISTIIPVSPLLCALPAYVPPGPTVDQVSAGPDVELSSELARDVGALLRQADCSHVQLRSRCHIYSRVQIPFQWRATRLRLARSAAARVLRARRLLRACRPGTIEPLASCGLRIASVLKVCQTAFSGAQHAFAFAEAAPACTAGLGTVGAMLAVNSRPRVIMS